MEVLSDPDKDRTVKSVKPPPHKPLSRNLLFPDRLKNKPDWKLLRDHLFKEGRIEKNDLIKIVTDVNKILKNEGNLVYIQDPLTVVGDIHGQYYDFIKIIEVGGAPDKTKYLFLGDFVDRGSFSIEVLILLYAMKIRFPDTIHMLRGNHECRQMTTFFNFRTECLYKFDQEVYDLIMDSFDLMPLGAIVNGKFLAVHGGISPEMKSIDDLNKIDRFKEPPKQGIFCDLLWSDPVDSENGALDELFKTNEVRGCSYYYGNNAVTKFLDNNNLLSIIRAHEAQLEGYKMHRWSGESDFPTVITIFSAPNYCDVYNNKGAVITFDNNLLNIRQYNYSPHPYLLPNFMDIFTWSIPFVTEKVNEMLYKLIKPDHDEDLDNDSEDLDPEDIEERPKTLQRKGAQVLKNKLKFVSKMMRMNKTLREQSETIVKLKGMCPDNKIPKGLLIEGNNAIKDALEQFKKAKKADLTNEKRPPSYANTLGSNKKK